MHQNAIEEHLIHGPRHMTTRVSRYMATGCGMVYFSRADISFMTLFIQLNQCITDAIEEHLVHDPRRMTTIRDALIQLNEQCLERDVSRTEICHATPRGHVP